MGSALGLEMFLHLSAREISCHCLFALLACSLTDFAAHLAFPLSPTLMHRPANHLFERFPPYADSLLLVVKS
ncbi:uncharacterized protein BP01DRAFT_352541 [Aspergillus saccharolyticus JOP 1030-1]|uniref:Uncharacterized protein n=1 Tax=Aspergillus saccharolyticus JOP 1030-1 TaxID=1450539 RepID=A0A318ZTN1_9EURO|nr:hypothetical protein BP01DRAFT_352541 [Aspergillus saccharolyticus JOP 1030-1]PYH50005.1 hypothetical protein BP01DRAFT_352541 [Aspergillus saccharolyticus JOP 1030-1]